MAENNRGSSGLLIPLLTGLLIFLLLGLAASLIPVIACPACDPDTGYIVTSRMTHTGSCRRCDGKERVTLADRLFRPRDAGYSSTSK